MTKIGRVISKTIKRGGTVLIPSFAVGRAQSILYYIYRLIKEDVIPANLPVYLDSPMAVSATEILRKYNDEHNLSREECNEVCSVAKYVHTPEESKALDSSNVPSVIISASGMATGGRILHHIKHFAPNPSNTILFVGYQAGGTRGDRMVRGEKEVKMHGQMVPINAEVEVIDNASAHADYKELLTMMEDIKTPPKKVFVTHGDTDSAIAMKNRIEEKLGWNCIVPDYLYSETLV